MKVKPIKDRVLILQEKGETKAGTFAIIRSGEKNPPRGKVVAVGKEVAECKVGDDVDYNEHASTEHEIDGIKYVLIRENEIHLIR